MIFQKPKNMRYVDMCIFIDNKIASGDVTDEDAQLIFEYLYHIIYMLSYKHKFFSQAHYYDEFAITLAGDVYNRLLTNPKLKQTDSNGNLKLAPIKSCLNYIKAIINGRRISFEQDNYSQKYIVANDISNIPPMSVSTMNLFNSLDYRSTVNVNTYCKSISKVIKHYIYSNCPYVKDKVLIKNIYISCLLSIINSVTFTQGDIELIQSTYTLPDSKFRFLCKKYEENKNKCIILYHLDEEYRDYITIMVRKLFTEICNDIKGINIYDVYVPEEIMADVAFAEIRGVDYDY